MNDTTIADTEALSAKSPVHSLQVQIKKAFKPEEGEGQFGPWRYQNAILKDESGEINGKFWNRFNTDLRNMEGEDVVIVSGTDKKGKFSGIVTDDYKGKRQLRISEHATFDNVTGEASDFEQPEKEIGDELLKSQPVTRRFVSEESKRESIEKQVALKAAVEFYAGVDAGNVNAEQVIVVANAFYHFLHGEPEVI